jgi:hypothetical protein
MSRILASRLGWIVFLALETLGLLILSSALVSRRGRWGAVLLLAAWTAAYFANYPIRRWAQRRTNVRETIW